MAGLALGAMLGAGIAMTGGLAAIVAGAVVAVKGSHDLALAGEMLGAALKGPPTGLLTVGSRNVLINGLPATMVAAATGECLWHDGIPQPVSSGAKRVLINGMPAARVTDTLLCGSVILKGSPNVLIGGPTQSAVCANLTAELAAIERFMVDAQAAAAAYDAPDQRIPPAGYRNATAADLRKLRLNAAMLEHPVDPMTGNPTDFRAAVFVNNTDEQAIIAYKGTTPESKQDWNANIQQGRGNETFYYDQAQYVARSAAGSPDGDNVHLVGHSLGGGMASAGAEATGLSATTFNAAGLNARTVPHPVPSAIDAVHVDGEILTTVQALPGIPKAAATRSWAIEPVDHTIQDVVRSARKGHLREAAKDLAMRRITLHGMNQVIPSLGYRKAVLLDAMSSNGCL